MISAGFVPADSVQDAAIIILNTCGFILPAKEESIEEIFNAVSERDREPLAAGGFRRRVVAMGCLTQRYLSDIRSDMPEIDYVIGIPDDSFVQKLADELSISILNNPQSVQVPLNKGLYYMNIKISEGCSNNCSYCAIPLIRGPHRSFSTESILNDVRNAAERGAKEVILMGQDTAAYSFSGVRLPELIEKAALVDGIEWIRLLYCHPDHLSDDIISAIADVDKVVRYIDLPFQHANERILKSMGRSGSSRSYAELVQRIRDRVPGIALRSTFMVGYPGETEDEFAELFDFVSQTELDRVGVFQYSPEEGTRAASMRPYTEKRIAAKRHSRLMKLQKAMSEEKLHRLVGQKVNVLVEGRTESGLFFGRTEFDAPDVDGLFYLEAEGSLEGKILTALVTGSTEYDLIGVIS